MRSLRLISKQLDSSAFLPRLNARRGSSLGLTDIQARSISRYLFALDAGDYAQAARLCVCGADDDTLIAQIDRYGIPLNTVLCRNCGLMRSDPYLTSDALVRFYCNDYRDIYSPSLGVDQLFSAEQKTGQHIEQCLIQLGISYPSRVFEIGCGAGGALRCFQAHGCFVVGCDYSDDFLGYGRNLGLKLVKGGVESLTPYGRADLVVLCHVFEHMRDPVTELKKIHSLLNPGGLVYVVLPGIFSIRQTYGDFAHFLQNAHVWHFCLATLNYIMSLAGFEYVSGNELIEAFYGFTPGYKPLSPQTGAYELVLDSIRRTERLRYFPNLQRWIDNMRTWTRAVLGVAR